MNKHGEIAPIVKSEFVDHHVILEYPKIYLEN